MRSTSAAGSIPAFGLSIDGARTSSQRHGVICVGHRQPKLPPGTAPGLHPPVSRLSGFFYTPTSPHPWAFFMEPSMATKLERQKEFVGYRTTHDTCGGCKHCLVEKKLPAWMDRSNADPARSGPAYEPHLHATEKTPRRQIHGSSVKKTAACNNFEGK